MERPKSIKRPAGKRVHFIGIGGIGMSALARFYASEGYAVSGSDISDSDTLRELRKEHIKITLGHNGRNVPDGALVIRTQAIPPENPEFAAAKQMGLTVLSYPEAVGTLTRRYKTVAISGSHGKSTTTALTALALINAGFDPTVIIGTKLREFGGKNFRKGRSEWLVLEADEFGRAFRHYSPFAAIATNIDREHLDVYKNLRGVQNSFLTFFSNIREGGYLIVNRNDKNTVALEKEIYIIRDANLINVSWHSINPKLEALALAGKLPGLPGQHNLTNASAAHTLGRALGIAESAIFKTLADFRGTWRRLELRGQFRPPGLKFSAKGGSASGGNVSSLRYDIPVYDDYAHHPTEIRASLAALKEKYPRGKIICVYEPHQQERLKKLFSGFRDAFTDADALILFDIYRVVGRDKKSDRKYNSKNLALAIKKKYPRKEVIYLKNPAKLKKTILLVASGPLRPPRLGEADPSTSEASYLLSPSLVMMGAGNIAEYTKELLAKTGK